MLLPKFESDYPNIRVTYVNAFASFVSMLEINYSLSSGAKRYRITTEEKACEPLICIVLSQ
jgi:hypothetical protein